MPLPITLAHSLTMKLAEVRKEGILDWVRPDGKSQVTVEYENGKAKRIDAVVIACQHKDSVSDKDIRKGIIEEVIEKVIPGELLDKDTKYHINETGRFVIGGPKADTGLTGRKIIVDTYGGVGSHGGGCFSGKDPSKVDRSASYMARYIAKNIVASGIAKRCEVQLAYAIGVAQPVSVMVNARGTAVCEEREIEKAIREVFDLSPRGIIDHLKLLRPVFRKTACYGHFGRELEEFTWEKTDKVKELREFCGL
jgi:S-adenosylmethionine synthetase